ncbi:hypothetical protein [Arthrobacter sp. KBS0703]|uniref:hypothetical protein n=1 Tax=Arthrobacter sp. KBS0703 TaxID=1955698 RepID=UPI0021B0D79A|nr:hypothetical protein [Arthrobacter sp. KBS0703]
MLHFGGDHGPGRFGGEQELEPLPPVAVGARAAQRLLLCLLYTSTQLDGTPVTAAAAAGAGTATGNRPAATDAATGAMPHSAASATPATAVHQQVKPQEQVKSQEPIGATVDPASRPEEAEEQPVHEAFWFAVAQHRTAVDERTGAPLFGIEPGGWVLALEDRGDEFLVQHTDGRVGVLRDLSNIERG